MLGAAKGYSCIVKKLLENGADTWIAADNGATALLLSCQNGHLSITTLLVRAGADLGATDCLGFTPLHMASREGHHHVILPLIEAGANVNRALGDGQTPLFTAAHRGDADAVRVLLRAKANALLPRMIKRREILPLDVAAYHGHVEVVRELLQQRGIEGCGGAGAGVQALIATMDSGHFSPRVVRLLVDAGVDTKAAVRIIDIRLGEEFYSTMLNLTNRSLREKRVNGKDTTEAQLSGLEGTRRLLLRVGAVHAVSWLWCDERALITGAAHDVRKSKITTSTPLSMMLPMLRRRATRPDVLLGSLFR